MVTTPRRAADASSGPYTCPQAISASLRVGAATCFAMRCACEQNTFATPTRSGQPEPFKPATAPAAIESSGVAAWLPGGDQARHQQEMGSSAALSIIDTIAAMRDDSTAVASTVDTYVQMSHTHKPASNEHEGAHREQRPYPTSPALLHPQHSLRPHMMPGYCKDQSPARNSSEQSPLAACPSREKQHAATINRISHEQCQADIAQLSVQNAELHSQLQSCTEQMTAMHGRVQKSDAERDEYANQVTQLREWLDDVRADRNRLEARMMAGSGTAAQDTRADLEASVIRLGREKHSLQAAVTALEMQQRQSHEYLGSQTALEGKVRALEARLERQRASRHNVEAHMKDLYADYTNLQQMHGALEKRCSAVEGERDKLGAALKERDERCAALKERARSKTTVLEQLRNAAQALVQDKERVATQLAEAVMQQSRLSSDNARMNEDLERLQGGLEEVALAMDVLSLKTGSAQSVKDVHGMDKAHAHPHNGNSHAQSAQDEGNTRVSTGNEHTTVRQIIQWLEGVKTDKDAVQKLLDQAQKKKQILQEKVDSVEEARLATQQELIELHRQAADEKRAAHADAERLRQAAEEREGRMQQLEQDLSAAAGEVEGLLRDKDDLSLTVDALQTDLASERRLNEEMQSILDSFRTQDI